MKKLRNLTLFAILVIVFQSCTSDTYNDFELIPFQEEENGDWGFMDLEGNIKIEPQFEKMPTLFQEGFAVIMTEDGYDYINKEGEKMGQKFQYATLFSDGAAYVIKESNAKCYINQNMESIFDLKDVEGTTIKISGFFSEGLAKFKNDEEKWGFINKNGKVVIKAEYDNAFAFAEGLALVEKYNKEKDKHLKGFIDKEGNEVIILSDKFVKMRSFNEDIAAYCDTVGWGFIDKKGNKVIEANENWKKITNFINGYASFYDGEEWGVIDKKGGKVISSKYDIPVLIFNGLALINEHDNYGFINLKGRKVIKCEFDDIAFPFLSKSAAVKDGKYYIFIGKNGKTLNFHEAINLNQSLISNLYSDEYSFRNINKTIGEADYFRKIKLDGKNSIIGKYPIYSEESVKNTSCYHFTRNSEGKLIGIEYLKKAKHSKGDPFYGCSKILIEYSKDSEKWKFLDKNNKLIKNNQNVYSVIFKLDEKGRRISKANYNKTENLTNDKNGIANYLWTLDNNGNILKESYLNKYGKVIDNYGVFFTQYNYDNYGNEIKESYYDNEENPTENDGGIAIKDKKYDKYGNLIETKFLDKDGQIKPLKNGIAIYRKKYDNRGNNIESAIYDENEQLIEDYQKIAIYHFKYDDMGNTTEIKLFNKDNELTEVGKGKVAIVQFEYDENGDLTKTTYLKANGEETNLTY